MLRTPRGSMFERRSLALQSYPGPRYAVPGIVKNSYAPPESTIKTDHDIKMAARQSQIDSLPAAEKTEQEKWAQMQIQQHTKCPAGLKWKRIDIGYQCTGTAHIMTHELLAEGRGGMYHWHRSIGERAMWLGPLYSQEIADFMNAHVMGMNRNRVRYLRQTSNKALGERGRSPYIPDRLPRDHRR